MTTQEQIDANRANSKRSTGPKTVSGKLRCRFNAVKLGAYARMHLLPGEDAEAYLNFEAEMADELQPKNIFEALVVNELVNCFWRLTRLAKAEFAAITRAQLSIVLDELWQGSPNPAAKHDELKKLLKEALLRENRRQPVDASKVGMKHSAYEKELLGTMDKADALPLGVTMLESHALPKSNSPVLEIERQRRALLKELLDLYGKLMTMQEQRMACAIPAIRAESPSVVG